MEIEFCVVPPPRVELTRPLLNLSGPELPLHIVNAAEARC